MTNYDITIYDCEHHTIGAFDVRTSHSQKGTMLYQFWSGLALKYYSVEEVLRQLHKKLNELHVNSVEYKHIDSAILSLKQYDSEGNYVYVNWN